MFARLASLVLASVLAVACGTENESPARDRVDGADLVAAADPGCGTYADPYLDLFRGCTPQNIGALARVDMAEDGPEVYRCTEDGFVPVEGRCRFYGEALYCGCGVDDGPDGPAP